MDREYDRSLQGRIDAAREQEDRRTQRYRPISNGSSGKYTYPIFAAAASVAAFAFAGFLLAAQQNVVLSFTRDALSLIMPDDWLHPESPSGSWTDPYYLVVGGLTLSLVLIFSLAQMQLGRWLIGSARSRLVMLGVLVCALSRAVFLVEGVALFVFLDHAIMNATTPDRATSANDLSWIYQPPIAWSIVGLVVVGSAFSSLARTVRRAERRARRGRFAASENA